MSFSSDCKKELCLVQPEKDCCRISELCALYMCLGSLSLLGQGKVNVTFSCESMAVARRVYTLLDQTMGLTPQIHYVSTTRFGGRRKCVLTLGPANTPAFLEAFDMMTPEPDGKHTLRSTSPRLSLTRACCTRAFLRGAFLGGGTLSDPKAGYHLELSYRDDDTRESLAKCLQRLDLPIRQSARKDQRFLYLKRSDLIVTFLTAVGAHQAVMEMENLLVNRQVLGTVNRAMNCDSFNLHKQMNASDQQVKAILALKESGAYNRLSPSLQAMAEARLNAPDLSLTDLGKAMDPPLGKSGVNHRMRRLMAYADIPYKE